MPRPARRRRLLRSGRRKAQGRHECEVGRPVLGVDVRVTAQVQITRVSLPGGKEETDLRADADRRALVFAELGTDTAVAGDLLIDIADQPGVNALADELRSCPVGMEVDA